MAGLVPATHVGPVAQDVDGMQRNDPSSGQRHVLYRWVKPEDNGVRIEDMQPDSRGLVPGTHVVPLQQAVLPWKGRAMNTLPGDTGATWVAGTRPVMTLSEQPLTDAIALPGEGRAAG